MTTIPNFYFTNNTKSLKSQNTGNVTYNSVSSKPQKCDEFKKKEGISTGKKIAIAGGIIAAAVGIYLIASGKGKKALNSIKKHFSKEGKKAEKVAEKVINTNKESKAVQKITQSAESTAAQTAKISEKASKEIKVTSEPANNALKSTSQNIPNKTVNKADVTPAKIIENSADDAVNTAKKIEVAKNNMADTPANQAKKVTETVASKPDKIKAEIEVLEEEAAKAKEVFTLNLRKNLPSKEERYKTLLKECGGNTFYARELAKDENYLNYMWGKTAQGKQYNAKIGLAKLKQVPERFARYKANTAVLKQNKIVFDEIEAMETLGKDLTSTLTTGTKIQGHENAYTFNQALRENSTEESRDIWSKILDKGFQNVPPTTQDELVVRGISNLNNTPQKQKFFEKLKKAKVGDIITLDKGYAYASYNFDIAKEFSTNGTMLTIRVPRGARVSREPLSKQAEMLFPRNAQVKVLKEAENINGVMEIAVEYILP